MAIFQFSITTYEGDENAGIIDRIQVFAHCKPDAEAFALGMAQTLYGDGEARQIEPNTWAYGGIEWTLSKIVEDDTLLIYDASNGGMVYARLTPYKRATPAVGETAATAPPLT